MATYNGERFIVEQVASILAQLQERDEVIVVDDASSDSTIDLIEAMHDPRIKVFAHRENRGYTATFQEAMTLAGGEVILLSDQDDVWIPGRVETMVDALRGNALVVGNCVHFGGELTPFLRLRLRSGDSTHHVRNILGILVGYRLHWGSAMGLRSEFRRLALPFPAGTKESHDQWLALAANIAGNIAYLDDDLLLHRLHSSNVTPVGIRGLSAIVRARWQFVKDILIAARRVSRLRQLEATQ